LNTAALVALERLGRVSVVTLDRPAALNAINGAMADELAKAFDGVSRDHDTWVVVLRGNGDKAFCVGADLKERERFGLDDFHANRKQVSGMFRALRQTPQPVIASIFGYALGGGFELALSCDIIIAAQGTKMGLPEARVGLVPGGGGTQLLTRKVGTSRAKELIFRGRRIDTTEAHELGLVADVTTPEELDDYTLEIARDICRSSPTAVRAAKRAIDAGLGVGLEEGIAIENDAWKRVVSTDDRAEGIAAFNAKREPEWRNK
jgi:enoyl-CoA hydratase/carnithine racemase